MKPETRYSYEKRIKELEGEVDRLRNYRDLSLEFFTVITDCMIEGRTVNQAWIIKRFRSVMK